MCHRLEIWQVRMREIQGAICVASLVQVVLGLTPRDYYGVEATTLDSVSGATDS